jgi:Effector-associated domain 1
MTTDLVRIRVLGVRAYPAEVVHLQRACRCLQWATQWRDRLLEALPASARGRIDLDVQMAHPSLEGLTEQSVLRTVHESSGWDRHRSASASFGLADMQEARNGDQDGLVAKNTLDDHDSAPAEAETVSLLASTAAGFVANPLAQAGRDPVSRQGCTAPLSVGDPLADDEAERHVAALAQLLLGDDGAKVAMREHLVAMIDEFEPDVVLGYRMGSVLAYEALALARRQVPLFVSVSSPIAEPRLFSALSPEPTYAKGRWPDGAEHWIDIYDRQDPFAVRHPLIEHFDGPVSDRPVVLAHDVPPGEDAYLSCQVMGIMLEDYFGRRRVSVNLSGELRRVLSDICPEDDAIRAVLSDIEFPMSRLPVEFRGADETWRMVIHELTCGVLERGMNLLVDQAKQRYPDNRELRRLSRYCNRPAARH